jgi:hypothetical protein
MHWNRHHLSMATYFNLARGTKVLPYASNFPWPMDIDVCFEPVLNPIAFSEGVGHGAAGCAVSATEALEAKWREHFQVTDGEWLIPFVEQLAAGNPLPKEAMLEAFYKHHPTTCQTIPNNIRNGFSTRCTAMPSLTSLTVWSSRRQQLRCWCPTLRSGAAYRGR